MMAEKKPTGMVLVAGAGISGIRAAIELAESGYKVILTDASPQMGGILAKLDYQFPTDHCGMCRMLPLVGREHASQYCLRKSLFHDHIEILPFTEITAVQGDAGNYRVDLRKKARFIDPAICNEMGECLDVCPVEVEDEFNQGLTRRKAVYQAVPHNTPKMLLIDQQACTRCGECLKVCPTGAINLEAQDELETREVHAIILASGVKLYNTREFEDAKSYAVSPDVVTSLTFERMLSGSGTYQGDVIRRPSDGRPAQKIAWIQCMGSRNRRQKRDYCSSICCMFALKETVLAKEKGGPEVDATIFYMDLRTFGKGFQQYRDQAVEEHGVKLIRCRVQGVMLKPGGSLQIRYLDPETNELLEKDYDLVVLSTGQIPFETHKKWAELVQAPLDERGLLATEPASKVRVAGNPGLFLCGSLMGLTDISEAMTSGMAAAGETTRFLTTLGVDTMPEEEIPEPAAHRRELPQVAVALCKCGEKTGAAGLDYELLTAELQRQPGVGAIRVIDSMCRVEGETALVDLLGQTKCNRLLIGACQPFMYRRQLKNAARKAGFNSSLVEIFDLFGIARRGMSEPSTGDWTLRAAGEVKADLESLKFKPALQVSTLPINRTALVIGGGLGGMQAALSLAARGVPVHLVEKEGHLGGYLGTRVEQTVDGLNPVAMATEMKLKVFENKNITVHLNCEVEKTVGSLGSFESKLHFQDTGENTYLHHGAAILATGGHEGATSEYGYGTSEAVLTQGELKKGLAGGEIDAGDLENVVMIQCVGSRQPEGRRYCSRICCLGAMGNALAIREKNPGARVFILYRDIMTYGFYEQYYTQARAAGVIFMNYSLDHKPQVEMVQGKPLVKFLDPVLQEEMELPADLVVLSTGVDPEESNRRLAAAFGVSLTEDGFLAEADAKWRPIEFPKVGLYLAGTAHSPMPLKSVLLQAEAAAQKAYAYLSGREVHTAAVTSLVKDALCIRCQRCVHICPYGARAYNEAERCIDIDAAACQACGLCAVECQNNAAEVKGWSDKQLLAAIDAQLMDITLASTVG
ncbi:MAG: FAD-dependent oxidoreductase [Thermodesulfobacteriota bacterium]